LQKARLDQIRREKQLEDHEEDSMGEYMRIYPTTDWTKAKVYETLIKSANKVSLVGK
jgi:3'-phosphoadenosine 5'-phosphosulfate sulfotransferase (PAPS reductase)/FAD synthetase